MVGDGTMLRRTRRLADNEIGKFGISIFLLVEFFHLILDGVGDVKQQETLK
jgi:hypothetical protein